MDGSSREFDPDGDVLLILREPNALFAVRNEQEKFSSTASSGLGKKKKGKKGKKGKPQVCHFLSCHHYFLRRG
jgi:hypothetical protein